MNSNDNPARFGRIAMPPEMAELFMRQRQVDMAEAGPNAPVSAFLYRGVEIASRWSVMHELDTMRDVVDALPDLVRTRLTGIWCDSQCGAHFTITVHPDRWRDNLPDAVQDAFRAATSGYNGLVVQGFDQQADFSAEWEGDDWDGELG